jgi:AGZA family xanthine/uracil permease-like MFS transporter
MRSYTTWLGIAGGAIMVLLIGRDFRGAVITGILVVTFISWIPGHNVREQRTSAPCLSVYVLMDLVACLPACLRVC